MNDATTYTRKALWVWASLFLIGLGWEIWTLFANPATFPTLSAVTHFFESKLLGQFLLYGVWVWWGWVILSDSATLKGSRARKLVLIAATAVMALWTTSLQFRDPARWIALLLPTGALLALSATEEPQEMEVASGGRSA